jgi:hypothetical protein
MLTVKPVMLEGNYVLLRPPSTTDVFGLSLAAKDGEIWNNPYAFFPHENDISAFLQDLLKGYNSFLPFIIVDKRSDTMVGSTRYLNIDYDNHRMEIGHTWIAKSFRRTAVNTEMKSYRCRSRMVFCRSHRCYLFGHRCYLFTSFIFFCYNPCCCPCALGIASCAALIMGSGKLLSFSHSVNSSFNKLAILNQEIGLSIQVIFLTLLQFTAAIGAILIGLGEPPPYETQ